MRNHQIFRSILCGLLTLTLSIQALSAQPQKPQQQAAKDALTIYSAGLDGLLVDPKDQGLASALRMLDERVLELPNETNQHDIPAAAIQLVLELFMSPMSLRAGMIENADPHQGPPFYAQFNFFAPDAAKAEALAGRFSGTVAGMAPFPSKPATNVPGMQMMNLDGVPLYHGAMNAGGETSFSIALNKTDNSALKLGRMDLPEGVNPALAFVLDAQQLQPFLEMAMAHAGPQAEQAKMQLGMMGLYGPNASTISVAAGHSADRSHMSMRYAKYRQIMEEIGAISTERLTADDLRRVPADATYAQINKFNLASIGESMSRMAQQMAAQSGEEMPDPMTMIEQQTGIHPQRDILDHLGQTLGIYMSDTTGGGGLLSAVMFVQVKNVDGLNQTMSRLNAMINQITQQHAKGYVRIGERKVNNQTITVLTFPGLPVPLELCWTTADGYLYSAGSPQALLAAIAQGKGGKSNLAENPRFKEMGGDQLKDAIQVSFIDTPRLIRDGYGIMSLAMAALGNAVRSPVDSNRGVGLIMPSYGELIHGAKAAVTVSRMVGDDLVMTGQSDRSFLVNVAGTIGVMGGPTGAIAMTSLMAGMLIPALGSARETAKDVKSASQLRQISMGIMVYSSEFQDAMPPSLQTLIDKNYLTEDILHSPVGPAPDGGGDYWIDFSVKKVFSVQHPDRRIMGYDRAMYANGDDVAVVYFDGHVKQMPIEEFDALVDDEVNAGVDFNLPQ